MHTAPAAKQCSAGHACAVLYDSASTLHSAPERAEVLLQLSQQSRRLRRSSVVSSARDKCGVTSFSRERMRRGGRKFMPVLQADGL